MNKFIREIYPNEKRSFWEFNNNELDLLLCQFYMKAKKLKEDDGLYQPDTLNSFRNSWQRKLSEEGKIIDLKLDKDFEKSRKVLASRRKELTQMGKGGKPNACRAVEDEEVERLHDSDFFSFKTP